jgi:hypothetical protein
VTQTSSPLWVGYFLTPTGTEDCRLIADLFNRRMSLHEAHGLSIPRIAPLSIAYASNLRYQYFRFVQRGGDNYEFYPLGFSAGFTFLWRELSKSQEQSLKWLDIADYAFGMLRFVE